MTNDPVLAFQVKALNETQKNGKEPVLGGQLRSKAVWVDESLCIGCTYCSCVATNTFAMEPVNGRARAFRQDGDSTQLIQEAIDTCPVNCIDWVGFEDLDNLKRKLKETPIRSLGLPPLR
ncbi:MULTISPECIES: ferredoxin [unclassified Prochlorococcus]|uniref:ferredoxin n=1 Tax=unclassified Prochlorococcus TaxID=2627481 RepID=UPI000533BB14|nr:MULTISPECIES: ferredoxin [unclassified Prochlorococcus]KGG14762.1 Ferredoxin [Prochlorococcus sp. MIT 0602]KGG15807.1 Ferredoxin [Prochlorococcus sp. MIT 0603]